MEPTGEMPPDVVSSAAELSVHSICAYMSRVAGLPMCAQTGRMGFEFSGLDYSLVLLASFPNNNVVPMSSLCWAEEPMESQLQDNIRVFLQTARSLLIPSLPFPDLDALPKGAAAESLSSATSVSRLAPKPENIIAHLAVQEWLYRLGQRFPAGPNYDGSPVRSALFHAHGLLRHQQAADASDTPQHCAVHDGGEYNKMRKRALCLREQVMRAQHAAFSSLAANGAVDWDRVAQVVEKDI
jgi:hypothetical protein